MKCPLFPRIAFIFAVILPTFSAALSAQTNSSPPASLPGVSRTYDQRVTNKYDKFKQKTYFSIPETSTSDVTLTGHSASPLVRSMESTGGFSCPGEVESCRPTKVEILFVASTADWAFQGSKEANFLIDGKPLSATFDHDGQVLGGDDLIEYLDVLAEPSVLVAIGKAQKVEVQLGHFEFELTTENIANLRALAQHVTAR